MREEFLVPLTLTLYAIAAAAWKFFKTGVAFWMNIQTRFDEPRTA
ncbi:hypothetical protein [Bradyrhizobium betae]|nr:hypothetical protein [Bradyrhizobium betae]